MAQVYATQQDTQYGESQRVTITGLRIPLDQVFVLVLKVVFVLFLFAVGLALAWMFLLASMLGLT